VRCILDDPDGARVRGRRGAAAATGAAASRFEFVHRASLEKTPRRNNQSCVLRVASGGASMLLAKDIERFAES